MKIPEQKRRQCGIHLFGYLLRHAEEDGGHLFAVRGERRIDYREALRVTESIASDFLSRGMKKGDLVALRATRSPDTALITLALCAAGAVVVTTDAHFPVRDYIADSGVDLTPDWWITNERAEGGISADGDWELTRRGEEARPLGIGTFPLSEKEVLAAAECYDPEDPFMIIFTSGSTGKSKAVVLSHRAVIANPVDAMPLFEQDHSDVAISLLPLNHVFGFAVVACAVFCGQGVVFPVETDPDHALEAIAEHRVSIIYCVPTFFLGLLQEGKHRQYDISSLRLGLMAGGPFTEQQMRYIEGELGLQLMPGYGMSECVGVSTMSYNDPVSLRAAGVGRPYPMTEVFILGESDELLPAGEEGEICVRGMTMMSGYYHGEEETKAVFDGERRLHTGDLGYFDEDGILHVSGRKKDLIIRGGENLSAVKIEKALLSLEGVYLCSVVGVKDEKYGEVPCAAVVPKKGVSLTEEGLAEGLKPLLSKHELPARILLTEALPLTSSGKPDKQKIKELFL